MALDPTLEPKYFYAMNGLMPLDPTVKMFVKFAFSIQMYYIAFGETIARAVMEPKPPENAAAHQG